MDLDRRELQCILNAINENIFFKDTNGRYVLSTHVCNMLNSNGDSSFSIYGKTDLDIQPDKTLGKKFYEEDMNIIKTKNNVNYIEKMPESLIKQLFHGQAIPLKHHIWRPS